MSVADGSALRRVRDAVVGQSISRVGYWLLPPAPQLADVELERVHEADSVELWLDSGDIVRIRWAMAGTDEGLAMELDRNPLELHGLAMADVGGATVWAAILGQPVTQMRGAWQVSSENGRELLWAISFRNTAGGEVTVALGAVQDGAPTYLPDSLVVLFSSMEAREYELLASRTSAWGELLDPA